MTVEINWIAVLAATVSAMVVGFIWYAPSVFGNTWMAMAKVEGTNKGMFGAMLSAVIGSLLTAYILAHVSYLAHAFFKNSFFMDAVNTAFWLAIGIAATTLAIHSSFEKKPWKLTAIAIGNRVVTLLVMGAVIGLLKP